MRGQPSPNARRKHRLVLGVTFSSAVSQREAARGMRIMLDRLDLNARPVWAYSDSPYVDKLDVKERQRA